ncbi:MAG TPA: VWA domain-containing protein [Saprospiraceae bacterium]|nr:VWA domain-containing protein [Saprospiraceae bacterium]
MFQFEHPDYLWLLLAVPLLPVLAYSYWRWRQQAMQQLGQTGRLWKDWSAARYWWKTGLLMFSVGLLAFAWANPQWGARKQQSVQESADVFIALDISQSMLCRDVSPSRLELARIFTQKLAQNLVGERIGVIFFAGNAFLAVPLSTDYTFVLQTLQSAHPDLLTEQGTAIGQALELAEKSFHTGEGGGRAVVLITDGENHDEEAVNVAKRLYDNGIYITTVGAGTPEGGPIPMGDWEGGQFKHDENGEVVRSKLNEDLLRKIAQAGNGSVWRLQQGDRAVKAITQEMTQLEKRAVEVLSLDELESWYQWLLLPALLILGLDSFIVYWQNKQKT